jgi:hypothetical protein
LHENLYCLFACRANALCRKYLLLKRITVCKGITIKCSTVFVQSSALGTTISFPPSECGFPHLGSGGSHTCLRGRGWGDPIHTTGQMIWYSMKYPLYASHPLKKANKMTTFPKLFFNYLSDRGSASFRICVLEADWSAAEEATGNCCSIYPAQEVSSYYCTIDYWSFPFSADFGLYFSAIPL